MQRYSPSLEGSRILRSFVLGSSQHNSSTPLTNLQNNFHIDKNGGLPFSRPPHLDPPFQFHSKINADASYVDMPRLSVTRLLVGSWCELRDYYRVYSGSPPVTKTAQMERGTDLHLQLEHDTHQQVDTEALDEYLRVLVQNAAPGTLPVSPIESELAADWCENICSRLFSLVTASEAREVLVHGYLDLESGRLECTERATLVSGIIDLLKITNRQDPHDYSLFEELQQSLEFDFGDIPLNMPRFFAIAASIIASHSHTFTLQISDIKTRSLNRLPAQTSVLEAARHQVGIYRKFTETLAENGYNMFLKNAQIRHADVDKPIEFSTAVQLLRKYPHLLYHDYTTLAEGRPIGFELFDSHRNHQPYNLGAFVDVSSFAQKIHNDPTFDPTFDYSHIVTDAIAKSWKTPLTLRYFAARAAQFFKILHPLLGPSTSVEYYNGRTGQVFDTRHYHYDEQDIAKVLENSAQFWSGNRDPVAVDDLAKCKYCEFSAKCCVPHPNLKVPQHMGTVGSKIGQFLQKE
ncbi:Exonuclease V mitochondrial [Meyerozyma sp. JA9]|nr:Exonuclease V mitochondrial [Meyerozyma sp. JA9]